MLIKDCLLEGILANKLDTYRTNKDLILYSVEPLLFIRNEDTADISYWKLDWIEDNQEDILLLKEQNTPDPIEFSLIDDPHYKHVIKGSRFSVDHKFIKKVSGYGYKSSKTETLTSIILELEDLYIYAKTGAVIEIRITSEKPSELGEIIFTT
ncbi:hypothetical protein JOC85_001830 [Bacillus mesophilus]|uniref:Uncharacterized protein n=1 Tax=Bacillus mesophilus TaxID=1808955 RepID=A0A6M0Q4U4_9BACI|nr:hypothetical protein [Bacillus mesophilus]MBM7661058.1 hypothetical protein [Bacillus mesophilus]NEY71407.1 hypothetical protein [Bacillus mesophilus]